MAEKHARPQLRLTLPTRQPEDLAPGAPEETPFFRPKSRLRVRRARRGWAARLALYVQVCGALLIVGSALVAGYARVMASETLRITKVEVRGQHFLSEGEVRELLGPAVGENILTLDLIALKARLRASPWVAEASVKRTLPDALHVEIKEREPLALAELERLYLMDGDGALIDIYGPRTASFDLPIVRGLAGHDGEARKERAERAGALLRDLGDLGAFLSEVQVEDSGELRAVLRGAGEILRLGPPPYRKKFSTFLSLRKDLAQRCPRAEYFDLRYRDRIYAKEPLETKPAEVREPLPGPVPKADPIAPAPSPSPVQPPVLGGEPFSAAERFLSRRSADSLRARRFDEEGAQRGRQ